MLQIRPDVAAWTAPAIWQPRRRRLWPDDRVTDLTPLGADADYICLPAQRLTPVPEWVSDVDALGMFLSAVTPYQTLHRVSKMHAGQSLLTHGAGGAVGTSMLQLAGGLSDRRLWH